MKQKEKKEKYYFFLFFFFSSNDFRLYFFLQIFCHCSFFISFLFSSFFFLLSSFPLIFPSSFSLWIFLPSLVSLFPLPLFFIYSPSTSSFVFFFHLEIYSIFCPFLFESSFFLLLSHLLNLILIFLFIFCTFFFLSS